MKLQQLSQVCILSSFGSIHIPVFPLILLNWTGFDKYPDCHSSPLCTLLSGDRFAWLRDNEFARQTLAGVNPVNIEKLRVLYSLAEFHFLLLGYSLAQLLNFFSKWFCGLYTSTSGEDRHHSSFFSKELSILTWHYKMCFKLAPITLYLLYAKDLFHFNVCIYFYKGTTVVSDMLWHQQCLYCFVSYLYAEWTLNFWNFQSQTCLLSEDCICLLWLLELEKKKKMLQEFPILSKLDPAVYGPPESAITKKSIVKELGGMTVEEVCMKHLFYDIISI